MKFSHRSCFRAAPLFAISLLVVQPTVTEAQDAVSPGDQTAETVVHELYDMVTFPAGTTPDWDEFRSLFLPEAVVVLRSTREATSVFTLEGFVQDWLRFIEGANVESTGFTERIIRTHCNRVRRNRPRLGPL